MSSIGIAEKVSWGDVLKPLGVIFIVILVIVAIWSIPPLGTFYKRTMEDNDYETLIYKTARIKLYNGGKVVEEFNEARITFASPKSGAITFTAGGKKYCWQDGILIELTGKNN